MSFHSKYMFGVFNSFLKFSLLGLKKDFKQILNLRSFNLQKLF